MYWEMTKDFFRNPTVKYFILTCLFFYICFIALSVVSDIDYHKKKKKERKNKNKLNSQKQLTVSNSEI